MYQKLKEIKQKKKEVRSACGSLNNSLSHFDLNKSNKELSPFQKQIILGTLLNKNELANNYNITPFS